MLKLHNMIKVSHAIAYQIVFLFLLLIYDRDWQEGVLKVTKNDHFLVF